MSWPRYKEENTVRQTVIHNRLCEPRFMNESEPWHPFGDNLLALRWRV